MDSANNSRFLEASLTRKTIFLARCIDRCCYFAMAMAFIQILVAVAGFLLRCSFSPYILGFVLRGNSFWVAGPVRSK